MSARCPHRRALLTICMGYRHRRALLTPARVISPSRCRQPPHDVNDPLTVPTTRVHTRGSTRTRARPQEDCSGSRTTPSEYAHKDPDSRNTNRTQGRNQALVCDTSGHGHRKRTERRDGPTNQRRSKPANPRRKRRLTAWAPAHTAWGPAPAPLRGNPLGPSSGCGRCRTAWGAAPAAPPYGSGFTARCRATMPPVRLRYWTSDQPLRAIMAPRARWSGHWRIDSTK